MEPMWLEADKTAQRRFSLHTKKEWRLDDKMVLWPSTFDFQLFQWHLGIVREWSYLKKMQNHAEEYRSFHTRKLFKDMDKKLCK